MLRRNIVPISLATPTRLASLVGSLAVFVSIAIGGGGSVALGSANVSRCPDALGPLVVVVACDGHLGSDFRIASRMERRFQASPSADTAWLRGEAVQFGERTVVSGTASSTTALVLVYQTPSGRTLGVRFQNLGLTHGGRVVLTVTRVDGQARFRLFRANGSFVEPASTSVVRDRQYVARLQVVRRGSQLHIGFIAAGKMAEIALLDRSAALRMLAEGELEDPFLSLETIRTRAGEHTELVLPMVANAAYVYVKPLDSGLVLPALTRIS